MVLSEHEAETRLAELHRQREAIDRAITDLTLYLELGRRLTVVLPAAGEAVPDASGPVEAAPVPHAPERKSATRANATPAPLSGEPREPAVSVGARAEAKPVLTDGVMARRYGRALIEAAVAVLKEAGSPLHASEIHAALEARGFTVPGQQDPVAALNTRLWKRASSGGPIRRLGDAIYALAE